MNKITRLHRTRFEAAKKLFEKIKQLAVKNVRILYQGEFISPDKICICETEIYVMLSSSHYVSLFILNAGVDEGCYTTVDDFTKYIKENFKLVEEIKY